MTVHWYPHADHPDRIAVLASDIIVHPDGRLYLVPLPPDPSWDDLAAAAGIEAPRLVPGDTLPDVLGTAQLYWPAVDPAESRRRHTASQRTRCEVWPDGAPCGQPGVETLRFCTGERDEHGGIDPLVVCADHLAEYLADQLLAR